MRRPSPKRPLDSARCTCHRWPVRATPGVVLRVVLDHAAPEARPSSVVVKLPPPDPAQREQIAKAGWFESEVRFYVELAGDCPVRTPRCFLADSQPEGLRWVLVLEALGPRLPALARHLTGPPYTLAHGDLTQRNASLGPDGRPTVFDWQLVQRARGARDVAYLVPFVRPEVLGGSGLSDLLRHYHEQLTRKGVHGYTLEELQRDQVLATTEVMQVGLATVAPSIAAAVARGERTDAAWIRGLLGDIARGAARLHLVERLKGDFPI